MHFYISNLKAKILTKTESAHFLVMRVQENKAYKASDLEGRTCKILITKVDKKNKIIEFEQAEIPKTVDFKTKAMFQAIPDKVYLDKLCEVLPLSGITDLFLFYSENSIQYPINKERLIKILIRSCEQAEATYLPKIVVLNKKDLDTELKKYLPTVLDCNVTSNSNIDKPVEEDLPLHGKNSRNQISALQYTNMEPQGCRYETPSQNTVKETPTFPQIRQNPHPISPIGEAQMHQTALIGPEGGWSESEIQYFQSLNLSFASLGSIIYPAWIAGVIWESKNKGA
jgi:RsmE family RNA methyltransferase